MKSVLASLQSSVAHESPSPSVCQSGTVAVSEVRLAAATLTRLGVDGEAILSQLQLPEAQQGDPHARVSLEVEHAFWELAERMSADPGIGLRVGVEYMRQQQFSLVDYLSMYSPTIRQALLLGRQVLRLADDRAHTELREAGGLAHLEIWRDGGLRPRARTEAMMTSMLTAARTCFPSFRLCAVRFRFARPRAVVPYERYLGVKPSFGESRHAFVFDGSFLDAPMPSANPGVHGLLWEHAQNLLTNLPHEDPLLQAMRATIARELPGSALDSARVAKALGMSERTLRRKLAERGTSHRQLVDELRSALATAEVRQGHATLDALAERLGFSSRSAFQRAFRRYTGVSPSQYRERFSRGR